MKERWQKISALALAAALTLLGGVQVFADGEQAPLTIGQSGPQPVLLTAASAETGTDGLQYSYHADNTATVIGYTGAATELVIPAEVTNGSVTYKVTAIGAEAFQGKSTLTRVTIPEGVTEIAYYAFSGCTSLTSVIIPESVTVIIKYAFSGCTSLTSVTIPEGVTHIGNKVFSGCTSLKSVSLPASLTECGDAFNGLNFTKVTFAHREPPRFIVGEEGDQPAFQGATIGQIQLPEGADEQEWRDALGRAQLNNAVDKIRIIIGEATPPTPNPRPNPHHPAGGQQHRREQFRPRRPADGAARAPRPAGCGGHRTLSLLDGCQI